MTKSCFTKNTYRQVISIAIALMISFIIMPAEGICISGYTPLDEELVISVKYDGNGQADEEFTVTVMPEGDAPTPAEGSTQKITLSYHKPTGELRYSFSFDKPGTYKYEVREVAGSTENVNYDTNVYTLIFGVFNGDSGTELRSEMRVTKLGDPSAKPDAVAFVNSLATSIVTDDPPVRKIVKGTDREDPFVFLFKPLKAGNPMPQSTSGGVCKVTIRGSGEEEFGMITFTEPGVYEYEVTERNDRIKGYTYDKSVFRVVYTVTATGAGGLSCDRKFLKNNYEQSGECVFTNTWSSKDGNSTDTGDAMSILPYAILLLLASAAAIIVLTKWRRRRDG